MLIANSNGQTLKEHLTAVGLVARYYAEKHFPHLKECHKNQLFVAALLHDIGKASAGFQNYIKKTPEEDESDIVGEKHNFHNEDGYLITSESVSSDFNSSNIVGWLVLHHHAPRKTKGKIKNISELDSGLKPKDREAIAAIFQEMLKFAKSEGVVVGTNSIATEIEVPSLTHYVGKNKKELNSLVRVMQTCLVLADRRVSGLSGADLSTWLSARDMSVFDIPLTDNQFPPLPVTTERDAVQQNIADSAAGAATTELKAPPGFGKTRTSLRWLSTLMDTRGPVFFVAPRNSVAESLYEDIIEDMGALGLRKSVELFLTGEVKKQTGDNQFSSDIIVTNIDSILSPFISHGKLDRLLNIFKSPMIIDEHHEFATGSAMFSQIATLITARERAGSPTLMMSATPIRQLLDHWMIDPSSTKRIEIKEPTFDNTISVLLSEDKDECLRFLGNKGCIIHNTVASTQLASLDSGCDIIHGGYTQEDKSKLLSDVLEAWGRKNHMVSADRTLSASGIVQASLNISFSSMLDTVASPETTIQRIGRLGRFDDKPCKLAFFLYGGSLGDRKVVESAYSVEIRDAWVEALRALLAGRAEIKRSELLGMYDKFCADNEGLYSDWISRINSTSTKAMGDFAWVSRRSSSTKLGPMKIGMSLRGKGSINIMIETCSGGVVIISTETHRVRALLESGYNQQSKLASDYIIKNRDRLKELGCDYPSDYKIKKYGRQEFERDALWTDKPLLCLSEIWGDVPYLYDSNIGLITNKGVLGRVAK